MPCRAHLALRSDGNRVGMAQDQAIDLVVGAPKTGDFRKSTNAVAERVIGRRALPGILPGCLLPEYPH